MQAGRCVMSSTARFLLRRRRRRRHAARRSTCTMSREGALRLLDPPATRTMVGSPEQWH